MWLITIIALFNKGGGGNYFLTYGQEGLIPLETFCIQHFVFIFVYYKNVFDDLTHLGVINMQNNKIKIKFKYIFTAL